MQDYSLDVAAERIKHPKTKEYFQEVMSSYAIGNYRSAVLSLYAIVISDLVFKLKDQVERESDPGAEKILKEVEQEKKKILLPPNGRNCWSKRCSKKLNFLNYQIRQI